MRVSMFVFFIGIFVGLYILCLVPSTHAHKIMIDNDIVNPTSINVLFLDNVDGEAIIPYRLNGSSPNPRLIEFNTDYLPAVVGGELFAPDVFPISDHDESWALQAAMAQAITARTFALEERYEKTN